MRQKTIIVELGVQFDGGMKQIVTIDGLLAPAKGSKITVMVPGVTMGVPYEVAYEPEITISPKSSKSPRGGWAEAYIKVTRVSGDSKYTPDGGDTGAQG